MQWLRLYDDVLDDPKVQRLPLDRFKHWINLLCLANKGEPRGRIANDIENIAFSLRLTVPNTTELLDALEAEGLIEYEQECRFIVPHNWDERQFKSDDVNARVKAHRERNVTGNVTSKNGETLHVTAPDTDTDTDTDTEQSQIQNRVSKPSVSHPPTRGAYTVEFEELFWKRYPPTNGSKADAFKAWKQLSIEERASAIAALPTWLSCEQWRAGYVKHAGAWLRGRMWEVAPANGRASPNGHAPPVELSPERIAEHQRKARALGYQGEVRELT